MGLNFDGNPPAFGGKIVAEVPTPTYSGKKSTDADDSINPYTEQGPGPGGTGATEEEINDVQNPPSGVPSGTELIPLMDSASDPLWGTSTWSSEWSAPLQGWHCFDNAPPSTVEAYTAWLSSNAAGNEWVTYEFIDDHQVTPLSYTITSHDNNNQRVPDSWRLEGWNGVGWDTLDTVTGQSAWGIFEVRAFDIDSPAAHNKFRIYITQNGAGAAGFVMINQWQMSDQLS